MAGLPRLLIEALWPDVLKPYVTQPLGSLGENRKALRSRRGTQPSTRMAYEGFLGDMPQVVGYTP